MTHRGAAIVLVTVVAAVVLAHVAYYHWPIASSDRRWAKYVGDGAGFALLSAVVAIHGRRLSTSVGALLMAAGVWGSLEGLQQAACGVASWGQPRTLDLCVALFGPWPFVLAASVLLAWFIAHSWKRT